MPSISEIFRALRKTPPNTRALAPPTIRVISVAPNVTTPTAISPASPAQSNLVKSNAVSLSEKELIVRAIRQRRSIILVHGRAGTGKTTLIRDIAADGKLRHAIVAPTGIAALNVGGQTVHSFFGIPPAIVNLDEIQPTRKLGEILRRLDVLIIDEISMLRGDLVDVIDRKLQVNLRSNLPFGGMPILMVGDFLQLPPVVPDEEKEILERKGYKIHYAFGAKAFDRVSPLIIELNKVHRQSEQHFVELLSQVRTGEDIHLIVSELNARCHGPHKRKNAPVILAARNAAADKYNRDGLRRLHGTPKVYNAHIEGDFRSDRYPAPELLELKINARVMMVKNDAGKRWVNGSLGTVVRMSDDCVWVRIDDTSSDHQVQKVTWENIKYQCSESSDKVEKKTVGTYSQLPIRHAWAITIHKSQGLTLDDVRVDLGSGAFTHGQTYVALSRAKSLAGLSFSSPLRIEDIKVDYDVVAGVKRFS